jgi:hypothetical protein
MRARHRTSKLLLRHGIVYYGGGTWTQAHHRWLQHQRFPLTSTQTAFDTSYETVVLTEARRDRLDKAIIALAADPVWAPTVAKLSCLRVVSTLTAFALAVEIGDWSRFTGATIGATSDCYPPNSPAAPNEPGSDHQTGNVHARRLLVEAAWHHLRPYRTPGLTMRARHSTAPAAALARGHARNQRLHARWLVLVSGHPARLTPQSATALPDYPNTPRSTGLRRAKYSAVS